MVTMKPAYGAMIHGFVKQLMEVDGLTVEEARERLQQEVNEACDEIAYGDDDE